MIRILTLALYIICISLLYHDTHLTPLILGWIDLFKDILTYSTQETKILNQAT